MRREDGVDRRHDEAPPSGFVEKSLPLQQEERLQDRLTGNRKTLGQFVLNQPLSGFQPPATNVVEDRGIGALHKRRLDGKSLHDLWNTVYEETEQAECRRGAIRRRLIPADTATCYKRLSRKGFIESEPTEDAGMDEDRFNMSIRKFLKAVGVTSQREIETAVRAAVKAGKLKGDETLKATVTLSLSGVALQHEIDGEIELG